MTGERIVIDGGGTVLVLGVADDGRLHQLALGGPEAATVQSAFPVSLHPLVLPTFGEEALREPALRVTHSSGKVGTRLVVRATSEEPHEHGVEHRIELVRTWRGVRFYNDSIASSPSRTIAGLRSFKEKVILIAGGYDKHIPFDVLGPEIVNHVKLLVLCGATAGKIRAAVEQAPGYRPGHPEILEVTPFQRAVEAARDRAQPGDVVTLSPACAAFDQFKNFMERGKTFKAIVNSWAE